MEETPFSSLLINDHLPSKKPQKSGDGFSPKSSEDTRQRELQKIQFSPLIDSKSFGLRLNSDVVRKMRSHLEGAQPFDPSDGKHPFIDPGALQLNTQPSFDIQTSTPESAGVIGDTREIFLGMISDLKQNLAKLVALNPSRKLALHRHLYHLADLALPAKKPTPEELDAELVQWIRGPRSPEQDKALNAYLEEVATIYFGQVVLLKHWSDRKLRWLAEKDLGHINWTLCNELKSYLPVDRESWQITRQNLYSWYVPNDSLRSKIWTTLESWNLENKSASFISQLVREVRTEQPAWPELRGYDLRFFSKLWEVLPSFGFDPGQVDPTRPFQRKRAVFTPTLRDGAFFLTMPTEYGTAVEWSGAETSSFLLMMTELSQIWNGPCRPPLWICGNGLEVHAREQLSIDMMSGDVAPHLTGNAARMAEMEACDLALVVEERKVTSHGRSSYLRQQVEEIPGLKTLRAPGTSLGDLQACVSINKLRPGGLLVWMRDEALGELDGQEILRFLLERGELLGVWDLSQIRSEIADRGSEIPLTPRHLYVFRRELRVEKRNEHHPRQIRVSGRVRSHIEVPILLGDLFNSYFEKTSERSHWKINAHPSPTAQQEWAVRWPDRESEQILSKLDELKHDATPLGQVASIRSLNRPEMQGDDRAISETFILAQAQHSNRGVPTLDVRIKPRGKSIAQTFAAQLAHPTDPAATRLKGIVIFNFKENMLWPLKSYIESELVRNWLNYFAEKKKGNWVLKEETFKFVPIPKQLLKELQSPFYLKHAETNRMIKLLETDPVEVSKILCGYPSDTEEGHAMRISIFARAAILLGEESDKASHIDPAVDTDGSIKWKKLIEILPEAERLSFPLHSDIRLEGRLPSQIPIFKIELCEANIPGILLATETGHHLHIGSLNRYIIDILWSQLKDIRSGHPTWDELINYVQLPRELDSARAIAEEILRVHGRQRKLTADLAVLLRECQFS